MKTTYNDTNEILKTLPIGYYIGRKLEVILDETGTSSYFEPMNDKITISYPMIENVAKDLPESELLESDIRTLLYHEVSHALLTPKKLEPTTIINIVEDERIETILCKFYRNVNFKSFVKRVNHFKGEKPKTVDEAFYQLVRYRIGTQYFLEKLEKLIKDFSDLNRNSTRTFHYQYAIEKFYKEFCDSWKPETKEKTHITEDKSSKTENTEIKNDDGSTETENSETEEKTDETAGEMTCGEITEETTEEDDITPILTDDEIRDLINEASYQNQELINAVQEILQQISNYSKRNGSAINSYSGQFDVRSVGRDDYKYFVQRNRLGHSKANSKIHLNLFIDRSGSFRGNQEKVNALMFALTRYEKIDPNFSFDLITIGTDEKLHDKNDRTLNCYGGNDLTDKLPQIFKSQQLSGWENYNIVLFDGDAITDSINRYESMKRFSTFNYKNTTIISNSDNMRYIDRYVKTAKVIYTVNYSEELITNVFETLRKFSR